MDSDITAFQTAALAARNAAFGESIKVAGNTITACFTAPRLVPTFDDSTIRVDRYSSTIRVAKADVPSITTPAAWLDVTIELPDGASWRAYRVLTEPADIILGQEWRIQCETL